MSEGERASIQVTIAGEPYTLRTNADEAYTLECAAIVNDRIEEIRTTSGLDRRKAAILAALSLSDDVLQQRSQSENARTSLEAEANELAERLEDVLKGT